MKKVNVRFFIFLIGVFVLAKGGDVIGDINIFDTTTNKSDTVAAVSLQSIGEHTEKADPVSMKKTGNDFFGLADTKDKTTETTVDIDPYTEKLERYVETYTADFSDVPMYYPETEITETTEKKAEKEKVEHEGPVLAITFDDGPHESLTPKLLDGLKERNVEATFFLLGHRIPGNEAIIKRMYDEGHDIGNHSEGHKLLTSLKDGGVDSELDQPNQKIEAITGEKVTLMRPPYGGRDDRVMNIIKNKGMSAIMWNIDPEDWKHPSPEAIADHIVSRAKDGDIILLHDIHPNSVDGALLAIDRLEAAGFKFLKISDFIDDLEPGGVYHSGV